MSVEFLPTVEGLSKFGDYSPVAIGKDMVAIAGQFGTEGEDPEEQVRGAFKNLGTALAAAGLGFKDVMKFTTFVVGRETIPAFMKVRKEIFAELYPEGIYPPNTLLVVAGLVHEEFVFEVEALAQKRN